MKFKSYIGLDVNKVCGINKYQKPRGFAARPSAPIGSARVCPPRASCALRNTPRSKFDRPEIFKSALNVSGQERNFSIRKIVNAAGDLHLLVLCETRKQGLRRLQPFHVERDIFRDRKIYL